MISMEVNALEVERLALQLDRFVSRSNRARFEMLQAIGDDVMERDKDRIGDQYDPDGQPWAPWSPNYEGNELLNLTGRMRDSFQSTANSRSVRIENAAPYAKFHQKGTRKMPARPILGWGPEEIEIANQHAIARLKEIFT